METNMSMSKIVAIHRKGDKNDVEDEDLIEVGPRQLAIEAGKITMIVEFVYLVLDSRQGLKGRELKSFMSKFDSLDRNELLDALQVPEDEFMRILNQVVECIGCRRIIERVFQQFKTNGSSTLDPLWITPEGVVRIRQEHLDGGQLDLGKLLQKSVFLYAGLLTYKQRSKQSIRCTIHNLDAYKITPFSETWIQIWNSMRGPCREKILIIDMDDLLWTLDIFLKKHKFCHECSAKVETAFHLLFREKNPKKEPGYSEELYAGIKRCLNKHIQLPCKVDFIDMLIRRAEPELVDNGNRARERHAKTLEIAQEEVLTCIGMCIFERFRRIHNSRKEEEGACQLLAVLSLHGMYRSFDLAVEKKRGISNLELLYEEISQQEQRQELKKEQKRLKKRQKKMEKRSFCSSCKQQHAADDEVADEDGGVTAGHCQEHSKHCGTVGGESTNRSKKAAKRKSRCNSENDILEDDEEEEENEDPDEEYDDDEPSLHELELIVAHKNSSKLAAAAGIKKQQQQQQQQNYQSQQANNNKNGGAPKKVNATTTTTAQSKLEKKLNNNGKENAGQAPVRVVRKAEKGQSPTSTNAAQPPVAHNCATCEDAGTKRKPLQSQPISVDCGYVSDQLSLTNCSSTSSSSLEDQLPVNKGGGGRISVAINKSPISDAPCSSPLTINSQLSSLPSSPDGSEVACQDGLCSHPGGCEAGVKELVAVEKEESKVEMSSPIGNTGGGGGGGGPGSALSSVAGSYIPEELINEFHSKHRNLKETREALRRNLRQNFAQFCLKNKNRPLSHLCRTGNVHCNGEC